MGGEGIVMGLASLQAFFYWCMIINSVVYAVTALALLFMKGFVIEVNARIFGIDEAESQRTMQVYMANYKLLITVFNFTPWLALMLIR